MLTQFGKNSGISPLHPDSPHVDIPEIDVSAVSGSRVVFGKRARSCPPDGEGTPPSKIKSQNNKAKRRKLSCRNLIQATAERIRSTAKSICTSYQSTTLLDEDSCCGEESEVIQYQMGRCFSKEHILSSPPTRVNMIKRKIFTGKEDSDAMPKKHNGNRGGLDDVSKASEANAKDADEQHDDVPYARAPIERRRLSLIQSAHARDDAVESRGRLQVSLSPQKRGARRESLAEKIIESSKNISVAGEHAAARQQNFENKPESGKAQVEWLTSHGIGHVCKKGLKPESPNQDDFFIYIFDNQRMFGVFDGHGPFGHCVSNYVQKTIPEIIYRDDHFVDDPGTAICQSFAKVHQQLIKASEDGSFNCSLSGTTATVVLQNENRLYVAHVGDSRCVMARRGKNGLVAVELTEDHKPNNEMEKKRILSAGGQVIRLEGDVPYRVFVKGKLYPGLAMSRAIGDTVGTDVGVTCEPELRELQVDPSRDVFLLICSDGVWEFINSQEAVDIVEQFGTDRVQAAAEALARESWTRWIKEEGDVVDDITAQVVYLFPNPHSEGAHSSNSS